MQRTRRGLTIIELLIVIALVGIVASLGVSLLPRDQFAVNQAAERFSRDIERTRFNAISANVSVRFFVDAAQNAYGATPVTGAIGAFLVPDVSGDFPAVTMEVVSGTPEWLFDARGIGIGGGLVQIRFVHDTTGANAVLEINQYGRVRRL